MLSREFEGRILDEEMCSGDGGTRASEKKLWDEHVHYNLYNIITANEQFIISD